MGKNIFLNKALVEMRKKSPNLEKAFIWLQKAEKNDDPEAIYALGTWYLHGRFVKKNPATAIQYFLRASQNDYKEAFFDLAICYEKGIGVKKNLKKSFECYLQAALIGDIQGIYEVGRCYYYGIGIGKNVRIATIWLNLARRKGVVE